LREDLIILPLAMMQIYGVVENGSFAEKTWAMMSCPAGIR